MRTPFLIAFFIGGTAFANLTAPPELKTYLDSEKLTATISPTDATFMATFTLRSDEDISRVLPLRSKDVTVNLTIWLPEDGASVPLPRRFHPCNDNLVPLILENGVYREPIDTAIRLRVLSQSPETIPLSKDSYIHGAEHRRGDLVYTAGKSFLEPNFYKLVARFSVFPSVVKNQYPITFSYKSPLVRQNGEGLFYYVPFFDNLPDRISTSDTNRYAITIEATPDCSLTVSTSGKKTVVEGGKSITLAPKANEPIRATARSLQRNSSSHTISPFGASKSPDRQPEILAALVQSQIDTVEHLRGGGGFRELVLYVTQFPKGTLDIVQNFAIRENGRGWEYLKSPKAGAGHGISISSDAMQKLYQAIDRLPAGTDQPDLKHLVMVSYAKGASWRTSTYDVSHPSDELKQAFDICGCHLGCATNLEQHVGRESKF